MMRRDEALAAAREELARTPVLPDLWAQLREIIQPDDALRLSLTGRSGWLGGNTPLQHLHEPERVLDAARRSVRFDF